MHKLAIIHFSPIELYPPVMNWLNLLAEQIPGLIKTRVYTSYPDRSYQPFSPKSPEIQIYPFARFRKGSARRYGHYMVFYIRTLMALIFFKPDKVLYYESLSAWPAIIYKKYFKPRCELLIHYHEYTPVDEYLTGMKLARLQHEAEKKTYPAVAWISHTNSDRMERFQQDNPSVPASVTHVLPNYPPKAWTSVSSNKNRDPEQRPVKFIYVGAISMDTTHLESFATWVLRCQGKVHWDIYSTNMTAAAATYLERLDCHWISFKGGMDYYSLPELLSAYRVGVILYKGHIANYVYNAPNKLFEYAACGLDVWFPATMQSSLTLVTEGTYPKVLALDFDALDELDLDLILDQTHLAYKPASFHCETALLPLLDTVLSNRITL